MPTIGEMLHMDDDGRFTTAGAGASVSEELDRRWRDAHADDQVKLTDQHGNLCGYLTLSQVWSLSEAVDVKGSSAILGVAIDDNRRIDLLRLSFSNKGLAPAQNAEVSTAIDRLLGHKAVSRKHPQKMHMAAQPSGQPKVSDAKLYVTRDSRGTFLGIHSMEEASGIWPAVVKRDNMLYVAHTVEFSAAYEAACRSTSMPTTTLSSRVNVSVKEARSYLLHMRETKAEGYWRDAYAVSKKVYYKTPLPICTVPLYAVEKVFGDAWFNVSGDSVQIMRSYAAKDISALAIKAMRVSAQPVDAKKPSKPKSKKKTVAKPANSADRTHRPLSSSTIRDPTILDLSPSSFKKGVVRVHKTSLTSVGASEFKLVTRRGTTIGFCSFDDLSRLLGMDVAQKVRLEEMQRLRREDEETSDKSMAAPGRKSDKQAKKPKNKPVPGVSVAGNDRDSGTTSQKRGHVQSTRPPLRDLLLQLGAKESEIDEITRLANAFRTLGRSMDLQRYAEAGRASHVLEHDLDELDSLSVHRIVGMAIMPSSGVTVETQTRALRAVLDGLRSTKGWHEHERTRGMLKQSHMFVFDEDAYQVASFCSIPLSKLPYQTCLVENVLLTSQYGCISAKALVKGADVDIAKRLMSFVVSCCTETRVGPSKTNYVTIKPMEVDVDRGQVARRAHSRRGHWRNQAYGPGQSLRKRIWIDETLVSESYGISVSDIKQVHRVILRRDAKTGSIKGIDI